VDEQRVDPAFARLAEALAVASRHYGAVARQANRRADLGTLLLLVVAATVIAVLCGGPSGPSRGRPSGSPTRRATTR